MHDNINKLIGQFVSATGAGGRVLDVGGQNVNGSSAITWRRKGFVYESADIAGDVTHIIPEYGEWDLKQRYDVVFSCSTLEHVRRPWVLARSMGRHVKPGGWLFLHAPFSWPFHRYPLDCWRVAPDGMQILFNEANVPLDFCALSFELHPPVFGLRAGWVWLKLVIPRWLKGEWTQCIDCYGWGRKQ